MTPQTDYEEDISAAHDQVLNDAIAWHKLYKDAQPEEKAACIEQWGLALSRHFGLEKDSSAYASNATSEPSAKQIGESVIAFFDAAHDMLLTFPWRHDPQGNSNNPALIGMAAITDAFAADGKHSKFASPTMAYVLDTLNWNPDGLWLALASTQEDTRRQLALDDKDWRVQPFWRWTAQLGVQACGTDWKPNNNTLSEKMWYVTPFRALYAPDSAVSAMATKVPWSFGAALEFYQDEDEEHVTPSMVQSIFTMDYAQANARLSTELLLHLMFNHARHQSYESGMALVQERHPDLYAAFQLQVSLHDDVYDAEKYAPACLDSWNHAIHGKALDSVPLPDLGFEGP